ncbi:MAG: SURF1 family protein [Parvibaculum sp.]|uniref:SURF1 family protein n=1 Tax=Parvibaculum sp. TaxID=2024848 RepID=UPI0032EB281F
MTNRVFRPMLWPTLLTAAMLPVLLGLGFWQVERLEWKRNLMATMAERMAADPVALPAPEAWPSLDAAALEYTRVSLTGRFMHEHELHYFTQAETGAPGYAVIVPLLLDGEADAVVLVDRGFVPVAMKDPAMRAAAQPEGRVSLTGILRTPQRRGSFDGADDPQNNVWMVRDPARMGAHLGLTQVAPFIVEAEIGPSAGPWPKAGRTRVDLPNNHLDYALTWFGLALVLTAIYLIYHRSQGRLGRPKR